jgi:integrating conjugative element protein (TIGR03765 family)
MNRMLLAATAALLAVTADAQDRGPVTKNSSPPLIMVEDKGGTSALPYYRALNPQDAQPGQLATPQAAPPSKPRIGSPAEAEAAMLPVRSARLTPGDEPRRVIRAPGLTPLFLVGDDDRSRAWLKQRGKDLQALRALGLVVNVATPEALAALRRLAPGLTLSPASGDDLAQRLGLKHYPVLVTSTGIEP